jgi:hypothetical protein
MISTSLYVLGPVAAFTLAVLLYVIERAPIIGVRWLWFLERLESYRRRKRRSPKT